MSGRPSDPNTRRLRRFVLLVIFAVTLPSLLLSGFGLIAINNERDAAYQRVREIYDPVVNKLISKVKERLKAIITDSQPTLLSLAQWGLRRKQKPLVEIGKLLDKHSYLANFFVLGTDDEPLIPRKDPPLPSFNGYYPDELTKGLRLEFKQNKPAAAVALYRAVLGELEGESVRCMVANSFRFGQKKPSAEKQLLCEQTNGLPQSPAVRCIARNALARCLDRMGQANQALDEWKRLILSCPHFVTKSGYHLQTGAYLRVLELLGEQNKPLQTEALQLARLLADPTSNVFINQKTFTAAMARHLLDLANRSLKGLFGHIESFSQVLSASTTLQDTMSEGIEIRSIASAIGRRMLVVSKHRDWIAGAEVIAPMLEPMLQRELHNMEFGSNVQARLRPTTQIAQYTGILAGSRLITDGQFAWHLDLILEGSQTLDKLAQRRVQIYLWILVLLVVTLVIGIASTVWVMVRETRLSRLKTDFVSSVSHELRTPLTSIRLFTETLLLGRAGSQQQEFLQVIGQESERLSRLVERILDFSRMEAGRKAYTMQCAQIDKLIEAAMAACRSLIDEQQPNITVKTPQDLPAVNVDRDAIVEVIINLLTNAIKYGPKEGDVIITSRSVGDFVELSVQDFGVGIPKHEQSKIFEKFYRVESKLTDEVSGSGLGLSLVDYIVSGHGGQVLVDSQLGQGSTFTIRLQAHRGDPGHERNCTGSRR